jgi:hypothetical protein
LNCNLTFRDLSRNKSAKCCSERCSTAHRNSKKYDGKQEGYDFIKCPSCKQKVAEITIAHAKLHDFESVKSMAEHYGLRTLKCQKTIDGMKGEKNPGYQHGGKLSPWSDKSGRSSEHIERAKQAAKDNSRGNKPNNLEHYLRKGFDLATSTELLRKHQSNGLVKMKELYGEHDGLNRWEDRQNRWQATLDAKSDEEKQAINKKKMSNGYSISQKEIELLTIIQDTFPDVEDQKYIKVDGKGYSFDIAHKNKMIEFFGDFWHHNPAIYSEEWINPYSKLSSTQKWEKDKERIQAANTLGYQVKVVWEQDWKTDKEKVIQECISFLKQ